MRFGQTAEGRELLEWAHQTRVRFSSCTRGGPWNAEGVEHRLRIARDVLQKYPADSTDVTSE